MLNERTYEELTSKWKSETMRGLIVETFVYSLNGLEYRPSIVRDMLERAYEAGKAENAVTRGEEDV